LLPVAAFVLWKLDAGPGEYLVLLLFASAICFDAYLAWPRIRTPGWTPAEWQRGSAPMKATHAAAVGVFVVAMACRFIAWTTSRAHRSDPLVSDVPGVFWACVWWLAVIGDFYRWRKPSPELPPVHTFQEEVKPLQSQQWGEKE
jgi:hypothetical protein